MNKQLERSLVAFIDILGFKDHIKNKTKQEEILSFLKQIRQVDSSFESSLTILESSRSFPGKIPIYTMSFSDHIIISMPIRPRDFNIEIEDEFILFCLINLISEYIIQFHLIGFGHGILLRGAIAVGEIYCDAGNNIIFGELLIKAIEDESKLAIYPRVILSESVLEYKYQLKKSGKNERYEDGITTKLKKDSDGMFYVDYLKLAFCLLSIEKLNSMKIKIRESIDKNKEKQNLRAFYKWSWLENYFKSTQQNKEIPYGLENVKSFSEN